MTATDKEFGASRATCCPSCGQQMVKAINPEGWWACTSCYLPVEACPEPRRVRPVAALKLPGIDRGPQRRRIHEREEPVQRRIIEALTARGYEVMVTSRRYKLVYCHKCERLAFCQKCGGKLWQSGGDGVSKGLGDLLVWHPSWPPTTRIEADVKGSRTPLSPEQKARVASGVLRIWRSVEEALEDVKAVEQGDVSC